MDGIGIRQKTEPCSAKKGYLIKDSFKDIEKSLPFKFLAINSDSGSEFLNKNMLQFTQGRSISFSRSRPYKKNDNCYVEQKTLLMLEKFLITKGLKINN